MCWRNAPRKSSKGGGEVNSRVVCFWAGLGACNTSPCEASKPRLTAILKHFGVYTMNKHESSTNGQTLTDEQEQAKAADRRETSRRSRNLDRAVLIVSRLMYDGMI